MVLDHKEIKYQGKRVFEKIVMSLDFKREPKYFTEKEACFLFLKNGSFQFRTPTQVISYSKNEAMLAKCGDYYIEPINAKEKHEENTLTAIGVYFYPDMIKGLFNVDFSLQQLKSDFDVLKVNIEPLMSTFIDSIDFLIENPLLADENFIVTKLKELILLLSKSKNSKSVHEFIVSLFVSHEYNFKEIIEAHVYSDLNIEQIAHLCGMSLSTFKRTFKELYYDTPAHYFKIMKLRKAADLLKNTRQRITDICYDCGFNDISHFSKAFIAEFKISPSDFRTSK